MSATDIIARRADGLPPDFLQALAYHESGLDPNQVNPASHATGLFQITAPVLTDYNRAQGTAHPLGDLKDPELATAVAVYHLKRILAHWRSSSVLAADFDDRRFVQLLVFGWNAGPNGVLRVVQRLERINVAPERITVEAVHEAAKALTADSWLAKPERVGFAKKVADTYFDARAGRGRLVASLRGEESPGSVGAAVIAAAVGLGAVVAASKGGEEAGST